MSDFDIRKALRWARFDPRKQLSRRADSELTFVGNSTSPSSPLLLDTGVYINQIQGSLPEAVESLIAASQVNHSTVAIQELMHTVGVLDPADQRTAGVISALELQVQEMPNHRVFAPDADVLGRAAILSGMLCRLQGYARDDRHKAHHDAVLYLQGMKLGLTIVTGNLVEFDYLLQLLPAGRVLFYRKSAS